MLSKMINFNAVLNILKKKSKISFKKNKAEEELIETLANKCPEYL